MIGIEFRGGYYIGNLSLYRIADLEWNGFSHPSFGRLARLTSNWRGITLGRCSTEHELP